VLVPIYKNDAEQGPVMEAVTRLRAELAAGDIRVKVDDRDTVSPGFKFNDWEMRGVPLRIEVGPKDVAKGNVALARRDRPGREGKSFVPQAGLADQVAETLMEIQAALFERALAFRKANTHEPKDYAEFKQVVETGWAYVWWAGDAAAEARVKDETRATIRCVPLEQPGGSGTCVYTGQPATQKVIFARAY
jgi:prolyl-tRNA synthetase